MRTLATIFVLGLTVSACGSSSSSGNDGGGGAGGGGGSGGNLSACNAPACLKNLLTACEASGTCVSQTDLTTFSSNNCYSNGVKEILSVGSTGYTFTVKKNSSTCYSADIGASGSLTFKDSSGSVVGTGSVDSTTSAVTVSCTGGQPVTVNDSCGLASMTAAAMGGSGCTQGTCTP